MKKCILAFSFALAASTSHAAIVTYQGADAGVGSADPRPNANAAASSFDAAIAGLGSTNIVDFESVPTGFVNPLVIPGVTFTYSGDFNSSLSGVRDNTADELGFNTTAGGKNYLQSGPNGASGTYAPMTLTLTFDSAIQAFGAFFTGIEAEIDGALTLDFNNGSAQSFALSNLVGGGVEFFGFTDVGSAISAVSMTLFDDDTPGTSSSRELWGLDDIRYVAAAAVPAPAAAFLVSLCFAGLIVRRNNR